MDITKIGKIDKAEIEQKVVAALKTCYDPEIPASIWDLGLVYETKIDSLNNVMIKMTLTAPGCPVADTVVKQVKEKVQAIEEVNEVDVVLTFEPPWTKEMMTDEARLTLGFM